MAKIRYKEYEKSKVLSFRMVYVFFPLPKQNYSFLFNNVL